MSRWSEREGRRGEKEVGKWFGLTKRGAILLWSFGMVESWSSFGVGREKGEKRVASFATSNAFHFQRPDCRCAPKKDRKLSEAASERRESSISRNLRKLKLLPSLPLAFCLRVACRSTSSVTRRMPQALGCLLEFNLLYSSSIMIVKRTRWSPNLQNVILYWKHSPLSSAAKLHWST